MRKILYILSISILIVSCSSDNENPAGPIDDEVSVAEGNQVFRIDLKELSAKTEVRSQQKDLEPAFALVSISDGNGATVISREKNWLDKEGGQLYHCRNNLEGRHLFAHGIHSFGR